MFLNILSKEERKHFLNLAYHLMELDGERKEEELSIYEAFVHECELSGYKPQISENQINNSITKLAAQQSPAKRAVIIELFGIMFADHEACDAERAFMDQIVDTFGFESFEVRKIERWVLAMTDMVSEGYRMVEA
ncbi:TerB family tellurite resistance protein [Parendozoicomonas haliclonae]|uniref:Tellurite resistance protein TerB n=1 Tax=Parendozoicomonas haliclonae TaxID=1960125 RepID=A0A1X7AIS2_9GAMM|nr:TerB family tellurite resistance protein [Parendozoicomonas haliclonae]SMA39428.1 Tellurite resistance protein TerB [Parendozoicomonas haliclonae]